MNILNDLDYLFESENDKNKEPLESGRDFALKTGTASLIGLHSTLNFQNVKKSEELLKIQKLHDKVSEHITDKYGKKQEALQDEINKIYYQERQLSEILSGEKNKIAKSVTDDIDKRSPEEDLRDFFDRVNSGKSLKIAGNWVQQKIQDTIDENSKVIEIRKEIANFGKKLESLEQQKAALKEEAEKEAENMIKQSGLDKSKIEEVFQYLQDHPGSSILAALAALSAGYVINKVVNRFRGRN